MSATVLDLQELNLELQQQTPQQIIEWAIENSENPIITTNFRPHSAGILHMATQIKPDIPVLWVDTGYNSDPTLEFAEKLTKQLNLNLIVYRPEPSDALEQFKRNGIPLPDDSAHEVFTRLVKLEPFERAFDEIDPDAWINGIRREQTEFRGSQDILTTNNRGVLKVAPLFHWTEEQVLAYLADNGLPDEHRYFDPTKVDESRECGLHTLF